MGYTGSNERADNPARRATGPAPPLDPPTAQAARDRPRDRDRGDGHDVYPVAPSSAPEAGQLRFGGGQVELVGGDHGQLLEQRRVVRLELVADCLVVALRVVGGEVDDMEQQPRALDMTQEGMAQAGAATGPFDQAGQVGDDDPPLVGLVMGEQVEHAQVGL